jgi:hypothetical protein
LQHPLGHDAALHTHFPCALHACPAPHAAHATPPEPHVVAVSDVWQWLFASQQPEAHVVASHTHWPCALHR